MDLATISTLVATLATIMFTLYAISQMRSLKKKATQYEPIIETIGNLLRYDEDADGKPMIDARLTKIVETFSSSIAQSLKMSLLGSLSGPARIEKGLKAAMTQDVIDEKMPIIGMIGDFLGINTKKYIAKHPDAIGQLGQLAAPYINKFMQNRNNGPQTSKEGYM